MISSTSYPYPVNDKSPARRAVLQPHIYSPSESHHSPRTTMYPSPSPNYIYSGYEQYYSKDSWASTTPSAWSTLYPFPRSSSLAESTVNPKVTILPPQPILVTDIDTPSSTSSLTALTPPSPFACDADFHTMDAFDEFDYDDEEEYIDSDFADDMEGIDDADQEHALVYGTSAPHGIKSTSALEGALDDTPSSSYDSTLGVFTPADRRLSASVPGYPSASLRSAASHQRLTSSPVPDLASHPSQHTYTQRNHASLTSITTHASPSLYRHMSSSSSLAGAFTSSPHASRPTPNHLPIMQPQPIRPIPPIPLADLTSSANANERSSPVPSTQASPSLRPLSPLPLLCQPVSDAIRYQLKEPPSSCALDDVCYDSELMCEDTVTTSENHRFTQQGLAGDKMYSCRRADLSIRW